ncbi:MAG: ADP-ribosylglycohydrolase family protein, partial [Roseiflexus sp.]
MWRRAWVDGVSIHEQGAHEPYRLIQNEGTGLPIQGSRKWRDYRVSAALTPHLARACGVGGCVQGMWRYYALLLTSTAQGVGVVRLVRVLDGTTLLAEAPFAWEYDRRYVFDLSIVGNDLHGVVHMPDGDGVTVDARDGMLEGGGVALIVAEGA